MNNKPIYISKDGLGKLRHELEELVSLKRPEIAQRIHDAKEHGDLTENAEYEDAKNEQAFVEGRIQLVEALIKNATLIDEHHTNDHVQIGSTVKVNGPDGNADVHDRRLDRGQAHRGPDQQREPGRTRPARQEEGRERHGPGARGRHRLQDRRDHRKARLQPWNGLTSSRRGSRGPQVVNDSKTPSGTVHVGSLRGPVILDVITRALRAAGRETTLLYGVDDLDPMDAQALLTPDAVEASMGVPLAHIPDQEPDGHASYARHHAQRFIDTFAGLGIHPDRYYWMSEHYAAGDMDPYIRIALDRAEIVREVYQRVANVRHPDTWHPISVICPTCGRVGTTIVTKWDGEKVYFECRPDLVTVGEGLRSERVGRAVSAAPRSCPGTSSGRRSGRCSA